MKIISHVKHLNLSSLKQNHVEIMSRYNGSCYVHGGCKLLKSNNL